MNPCMKPCLCYNVLEHFLEHLSLPWVAEGKLSGHWKVPRLAAKHLGNFLQAAFKQTRCPERDRYQEI